LRLGKFLRFLRLGRYVGVENFQPLQEDFQPFQKVGFFFCRCWCFHQSSKDGRFKTFGVWCLVFGGIKKISPLLPLHKMKILYRHRLQTGANWKIFQNLKSTFLENAVNFPLGGLRGLPSQSTQNTPLFYTTTPDDFQSL